ncbi:putative DNA-binding protein [Gordonia araii NBRC 100433]|uniref:Putative DNA-binding protein n=1 Tax=Gordonia araii NBRC 100433 TaxID=1073574 RepID=G7H4H5_9ACTN|nr:ComEA family DNA-binding protein [Gordonia araii]NNG96193.1 ComEA family DNA-binding protein [Gordonia araii NBRC 100433]GAB10750.1 putative DNA-binding protein [Gordonia araii NBRC 100433]
MGRGRAAEPAIVRQRLARLAARPEPEEAAPDEPSTAGGEQSAQPSTGEQWGIAATPQWLSSREWSEYDVPDADDFALTDLNDESYGDDRGHRIRPLPPAAVALIGVGVMATLVAAFFALRTPDSVVPVVDFPASAGPTTSTADEPRASSGPDERSQEQVIVVSVVGLVRKPGLRSLPPRSRVADAVRAAGGGKPGADLLSLNLARPLRDGDQVVVGLADMPERPGLRSAVIGVDGSPAGPPAAPAPGNDAAPAAGKVDLNTATLEQLDALPGVGPVTAKAIVDWRAAHGRFTSVDQLAEVDGIGPARLQRLRDLVTVGHG